MPARAVSPRDGPPALWVAPGTTLRSPAIAGRYVREAPLEQRFTAERESIERSWVGDGVLILGRPGRAHSIWLFWEGSAFKGWYVQLERQWQPFRFGFDTEDHALDIWIERDGSWRWKDEDELEVAVRVGYFTPDEATAIRAEGEQVVAEWPFPTGWEQWRPYSTWPTPSLPSDWAV
jgi:uncharacterized protein DUF402